MEQSQSGQPFLTALLSSPQLAKYERSKQRAQVEQWSTQHSGDIAYRYLLKKRLVLCRATQQALDALPSNISYQPIEELTPHDALVADIRDETYEIKGKTVHGSKHFAAGASVYCSEPYSGDGYERIYMLGQHKHTGYYTAVMGPTKRLEHWRIESVTHPVVQYMMAYETPGGWWHDSNHITESSGSPLDPRDMMEQLCKAQNHKCEWYTNLSHTTTRLAIYFVSDCIEHFLLQEQRPYTKNKVAMEIFATLQESLHTLKDAFHDPNVQTCPPELAQAIKEQLEKLPHTKNQRFERVVFAITFNIKRLVSYQTGGLVLREIVLSLVHSLKSASYKDFVIEDERSWQRARFSWLSATYEWAGERMFFLIDSGQIETPEPHKLTTFSSAI
ncbi:MAG TPA: hypothetical protein DCE42_10185 [Myxococcales bacterium]|nr:hypothetical protein [Deltaproteobacteria bacterium]MBU50677.1 hypothetical protein [Deltaproteobacteria bacterium]HAA55118.1 hypothetical protein [Myxococcales bacterium]|tara:strand:- start:32705 stop:33868 length:1164 start_codon:yes stop_codon:yes gene_type:complete